jgi:hypothetical protein
VKAAVGDPAEGVVPEVVRQLINEPLDARVCGERLPLAAVQRGAEDAEAEVDTRVAAHPLGFEEREDRPAVDQAAQPVAAEGVRPVRVADPGHAVEEGAGRDAAVQGRGLGHGPMFAATGAGP